MLDSQQVLRQTHESSVDLSMIDEFTSSRFFIRQQLGIYSFFLEDELCPRAKKWNAEIRLLITDESANQKEEEKNCEFEYWHTVSAEKWCQMFGSGVRAERTQKLPTKELKTESFHFDIVRTGRDIKSFFFLFSKKSRWENGKRQHCVSYGCVCLSQIWDQIVIMSFFSFYFDL